MSRERVDEACRLWREGFFRWSIVSGGVTPGSDLSECEIIAAQWSRAAFPPNVILREHRAMNTGENVDLLAADHRRSTRARQYPQRDLPRQ